MKPSNHIDGWLYVGVAMCTALTAGLNVDDAAKYFSPEYLFKLKLIIGCVGAGMFAGKMYRSTTYAQVQASAKPEAEPVVAPAAATKPAVPSGASNLPAQAGGQK